MALGNHAVLLPLAAKADNQPSMTIIIIVLVVLILVVLIIFLLILFLVLFLLIFGRLLRKKSLALLGRIVLRILFYLLRLCL